MVRKIKPISRVIRIEAEIERIRRADAPRREPFLDWDENWIPRVDVYEKRAEIIVEAEVPGVSQADLVITVQSSRVEIRGMKQDRGPSEKIRYLRLEREFGSFRRMVALPAAVFPDKAKAFLDNGVLTIRLKKYLPEEDKKTDVAIHEDEE